jgi:hypothetical protein
MESAVPQEKRMESAVPQESSNFFLRDVPFTNSATTTDDRENTTISKIGVLLQLNHLLIPIIT